MAVLTPVLTVPTTRTARRTASGAVALLALAAAVLVPAAPVQADEIRDRQRPMMRTLDLETAWKTTRGKGVTVAVVDSGTDPKQADLAGSVTTGPNMLADIDGDSRPARLHGTSMASLIAGHGHGPGRRNGIMGVAPQARILAIRGIGEPEDASYARFRSSERAEDAVARGIKYAADKNADVINLSLGHYSESPTEREAIAYAIGKGVVVVAAAGNDGDKKSRLDEDGFADYTYPASYPGVIAVAATDDDHRRAKFSNANYSVLVSAPGDGIPSAGPGSDYYMSSGTSDSTALVSGIAALIRSRHPKLPPTLVAQALVQSTRYAPGKTYDEQVGFGEVNAARALTAADALTKPRAGAAGKSAGQRFGTGDTGPVDVIEHPAWMSAVAAVVTTAGIAGTVTALLIWITLARRNPRRARPAFAGIPAGAGPPPPRSAPDSWTPPRAAPDHWTPPGSGAGPPPRTSRDLRVQPPAEPPQGWGPPPDPREPY
ncbi:S8 family serine peptidase [Actinomadura sp. 9N407]|uniref:S8 family serine peptidase n=1 Tax=Actinomadura sp. 9N407 TaxID=3375154 RepID=UPI0037A30DDF